MFEGATILITGGTGSWGHELVRQLLPLKPKEIIIYSRNESNQVAMSRSLQHPAVRFCIGDIRDRSAITEASKGADYIFHLAALKHVPVCEDQPYEALKTNVIGTQNVIEAAIENRVQKVLYLSTDKAANPSNFYGMTKAIGEKLITYANIVPSQTTFVCVRSGNVLGTSGSVVHLFTEQIRKQGRIGITDKRMTRFFLTVQDAVHLLFKAMEDSVGGEIFVMAMPTCRILDLAEVLAEAHGRRNVEIVEIGTRPGEKIHEILFSEYEALHTIAYSDEYYVILPTLDMPAVKKRYAAYPRVTMKTYSSAGALLGKEEIRNLLKKGRFLS